MIHFLPPMIHMLNFRVIDFLKVSKDENDENLFEVMLNIYKTDTPTMMSEIEKAFEQGDFILFKELLHSLSSTSSSIGATAIINLSANIDPSNIKETQDTLKIMRATLAKTIKALGELK